MNEHNEWQQHAACRGTDTNLFFSERGDHKTLVTALEICNGTKTTPPCPVKQQCLEWALTFEDDNYGVFGGLAASARLKMRRHRKKELGIIEPDPEPDHGYPGDNRRMYRSGRPLRSELPDRPLPTDYEWRVGLIELVRLVHKTVMRAENDKRAKKGVGPVAIEIRNEEGGRGEPQSERVASAS